MDIGKVHIDTIKNGDTILCNDGKIRTITNAHISNGGFMGTTLWGDSYNLGNKPVEKIIKL